MSIHIHTTSHLLSLARQSRDEGEGAGDESGGGGDQLSCLILAILHAFVQNRNDAIYVPF
jgi:hypothetical protein